MIRLNAPEGYKYMDNRTGRKYSEVITEDRDKKNYTLVPANDEPIQKED